MFGPTFGTTSWPVAHLPNRDTRRGSLGLPVGVAHTGLLSHQKFNNTEHSERKTFDIKHKVRHSTRPTHDPGEGMLQRVRTNAASNASPNT